MINKEVLGEQLQEMKIEDLRILQTEIYKEMLRRKLTDRNTLAKAIKILQEG